MKKILTICLFLSQIITHAQDINNIPNPCGSDAILQKLLKDNPEMASKKAVSEIGLKNHTLTAKTTAPTLNRIPVVVHVMHKGEPIGEGTNLSDDVIKAKIKAINEQYRKIPGSSGDGAGVDMELEFVLAVRDPQGQQTTGIVRYDMTAEPDYMLDGINSGTDPNFTGGISEPDLKALSFWDSTKYYNVWIVSEINGNDAGNGLQGAAQPAYNHGTAVDGFYVVYNSFKDPLSRVETHELGHAFLLYHTFQGDFDGTKLICPPNSDPTTQGDFCADTAPHQRASAMTADCSATSNTCYPDNPDLGYLHNYMNYALDGCRNMFTADQKTRAIYFLNYFRSSFLESSSTINLIPVAAPIAGFLPSQPVIVIAGSKLEMSDASVGVPNNYLDYYNASGMTFNWNITNGTETLTSIAQNPILNFTAEGKYDISHDVNNGLGTSSKTANQVIYVVAPAAELPPNTLTSTNSGNYCINYVKLNTIEKTLIPTTNTAYTDYINTDNTLLISGNTYNLELNTRSGSPYTEYYVGYVDWDGNGIFTEAEKLGGGNIGANQSVPRGIPLTIPTNCAKNTLLRMRLSVNARFSITNAMINGNASFNIGDTKDFGLYIIDPQSLGTEQYALNNLKYYPNPVKDELNITNIDNIEKVEVYNITGQLLLSEKFQDTNIKVNLSQLLEGAYIAKVYSNGKNSAIKILKN